MSTIFRFAVQTEEIRVSEVWSFFCNKGSECLYATRTSMREWLKISFHESRACHIKSNKTRPGEKDFQWEYDEVCKDNSVHVMRIIYGSDKLSAKFKTDKRVKVVIEEWSGQGSLYLDVFFTYDENIVNQERDCGLVDAHCINGGRWVYFKLNVGPINEKLPEPISGMTFHMGDTKKKDNPSATHLTNATALWYSIPNDIGTLVVTEASFAKVPLNLAVESQTN
ncbi:hypothetical protein NOL29_25750 [Vibrio parahaemolyticus]|uniref:hypothetical protein n=1 Tax=Vibrio parahaemolyticus TaxID=670 RepID=UPI00226A1826|nr:hypothetical protein [Vibrio parahaemolyticus]MCX8804686.1 hypothetical protein [Vibrio parahaemolyticus]